MKNIALLAFLLFALSFTCEAQNNGHHSRMRALTTIVEAYNNQDYAKMQQPVILLGKLLITGKALKKEFGPYYKKYGNASIDTVTYTNQYSYTAQLSFEKDRGKRGFLNFLFTEKGKVAGFGFAQPTLIYPKAQARNKSNFTAEEMAARIDSIIRKNHLNRKQNSFNGCVLALDKGAEIYKNCFGYADFATKTPLNDSTLFDLASCSKQFTAMAIMVLAEQGKLQFTDTLQKYIPGLPYPNITIENLLTHTSGLPDYERLMKKHWDKSKFATNYDIVPLFIKHKTKTSFSPNQQFKYSNTGYALLSIVIEKASGMSYAEFLEKHIFAPLAMNHTRVYNTRRSQKEIVKNCATGYVTTAKSTKYVVPDSTSEYNYVIFMDAITGDGTVNSSLSDLIIWDKALRENTLVSEATLQNARTKHKLASGKEGGYGYGVLLKTGKGIEPVVYHTGGWPGYFSVILKFTEQEKTVVVLSNNSYDDFLILADEIAAVLME